MRKSTFSLCPVKIFHFVKLPILLPYSEHEDSYEADNGGVDLSEMIPRVDLSNLVTEALLTEMSDKNWKTRNEGLTKLQGKWTHVDTI